MIHFYTCFHKRREEWSRAPASENMRIITMSKCTCKRIWDVHQERAYDLIAIAMSFHIVLSISHRGHDKVPSTTDRKGRGVYEEMRDLEYCQLTSRLS